MVAARIEGEGGNRLGERREEVGGKKRLIYRSRGEGPGEDERQGREGGRGVNEAESVCERERREEEGQGCN